ncbi:MerR family DNA-binding transcriptional regulator [Kibdelosporangium aridum]|uniref:MerR family DNA-binding transcriptional regulator n=1 Tax=Kibdelosporangium aridum TaxID=2030 RepID=A0A428YZQ2_KIBAR|nr:MerR family transcriptional regulator [Kibdelosporangium aridum]RSM76793.1 MerR family DNA-binding transcriptional regulator [Kibdelosporangium aridum]
MELWTIGVFARAARLSAKALRLYDELGLLPPAVVDSESGYRLYDPSQLEQARFIAWLRRLGMPLARIRTVVSLDQEQAAAEVEAYWAEVLAETANRGQLATFLVDYLRGRGSAMTELGIRYAARTDIGTVRTSNEDVAYASGRLLAVADGVSGGGDASAAAIAALKPLDTRVVPAGELLNALAEAVGEAERVLHGSEAVTTLTAMLWSGSQLGLVHIGDTRAYVLRDNELFQITHDHTWVQSLVDEGRLSPEEAESHPQRAMLARAISGTGRDKPDLSVHEAKVGDRYLLCSDGLTRVVSVEQKRVALRRENSPDEAVEELIALAYQGGAPDNIAVVVAEVVML